MIPVLKRTSFVVTMKLLEGYGAFYVYILLSKWHDEWNEFVYIIFDRYSWKHIPFFYFVNFYKHPSESKFQLPWLIFGMMEKL